MELQGLLDFGGGSKLQVTRRIYRLFSLAELRKLLAAQKLRRSFWPADSPLEVLHILQILGQMCAKSQ